MADYCTTTDVKANPDLGISSTDVTDYDTVLSALITQASRMIDRYLGKWPDFFYPSSDVATRFYTAFDSYVLDIDEAVSISGVAVSEGGEVTSTGYTAWAATDYILGPYNYTALGEPIHWIETDTVNGAQPGFSRYPRAVKVTGIFGYSLTPPDDIKRACVAQVVYMFMEDKQAYQNASAGGNAGSTVFDGNLHPLVKQILEAYRMKVIV